MTKSDETKSEVEYCPCGRPLHYSRKSDELLVKRFIEELGPNLKVQFAGVGTFLVPRNFIALHGISAQTAQEMKFEQIAT